MSLHRRIHHCRTYLFLIKRKSLANIIGAHGKKYSKTKRKAQGTKETNRYGGKCLTFRFVICEVVIT